MTLAGFAAKRVVTCDPERGTLEDAAVIGMPGRCEAIIPAVAPRNMAGNVGPPRKLPSDSE